MISTLSLNSTSAQHLILSTTSILSHSPASKLTQSLLNSFAHHSPSGVPSVSSSLLTLPPSLESILSSLSIDQAIRISYIALPVPSGEAQGWEKEKWWDVGEVLHELRHGHHHGQKKQFEEEEEEYEFNGETLVGGRKRQGNGNEGKRTVIVGIGRSLPPNVRPFSQYTRVSSANVFCRERCAGLIIFLFTPCKHSLCPHFPFPFTLTLGPLLVNFRIETNQISTSRSSGIGRSS